MSSGSLPIECYHRAQSLGAGTYGSVVAVYNDDGQEFAMKLFIDEDEEEEQTPGMNIGALREISVLRLFRHENAHKNIVEMVDVKAPSSSECEQEGAGIDDSWLGMAMPLYSEGTLGEAIDAGRLKDRSDKVAIAHGLLSAVAHLHDNGFIHRDIKSDNVMLVKEDGKWNPVLIDFSLAKVIEGTLYNSKQLTLEETSTHTGGVGTVTYTAPEVVESKPYGFKSDLWSVGVILLEMLQNHTIEAQKNKEALRMIEDAKDKLPSQPLPNLIRGLLAVNPEERLSARQALESPLFVKFCFSVPSVSIVDIDAALPLTNYGESTEDEEENCDPNRRTNESNSRKKMNAVLQRREKTIRGLCSELDLQHPMTAVAALCYAQQLHQLDDTIDNLRESQGLLDCVVLASRLFEVDLLDLNEVSGCCASFANWDLSQYLDTEATLWMLLDYCLLPRCI
jgi:serine/threonine protein kinase